MEIVGQYFTSGIEEDEMFLTDLDYLKRLRPESDSLGDDAVFGKG